MKYENTQKNVILGVLQYTVTSGQVIILMFVIQIILDTFLMTFVVFYPVDTST